MTALVTAGPADASDVLRCLARWALERVRPPDHEHRALLVAEEFPPCVLGTVVALGAAAAAVPLLAVRFGAWRVGEQVVLSFTVPPRRLPTKSYRLFLPSPGRARSCRFPPRASTVRKEMTAGLTAARAQPRGESFYEECYDRGASYRATENGSPTS